MHEKIEHIPILILICVYSIFNFRKIKSAWKFFIYPIGSYIILGTGVQIGYGGSTPGMAMAP